MRYLKIYSQVLNFVLGIIANEEAIAETESTIRTFVQPAGMNPVHNIEELVTKAGHCRDIYEEHALNEILIKGLELPLR